MHGRPRSTLRVSQARAARPRRLAPHRFHRPRRRAAWYVLQLAVVVGGEMPEAVRRVLTNCRSADGDLDALQAVIENLTFSDVQSEGVRTMADANLVKLTRLSQLCLEYLLHCQEALEQHNATAVEDAARWRKEVEASRAEAKSLNKRLAHMKKALRSFEHLSVSRNESGLQAHEPVDLYRCHDGKLFVTEQHAHAHIRKRYPVHEHEALAALVVRVPAKSSAPAAPDTGQTARAIRDAKEDEAARRQHVQALEERVTELVSANALLATQMDAMHASLSNAQHLAHAAEERAAVLLDDKRQLVEALADTRHAVEAAEQRVSTSEQLRVAEAATHAQVVAEKERSWTRELERERGEYMASVKTLLSQHSVFGTPSLGASRAGLMEDDESSADESLGRRPARRSLGPRAALRRVPAAVAAGVSDCSWCI